MARTISIGNQDFEKIRVNHNFYIDKTEFIREWWEASDEVTLITRPRRFGKTLNMSMIEKFFSVNYQDRGDLFEGLKICKTIQMIYNKYDFLLEGEVLNEHEKRDFQGISTDMETYMATLSLKMLSDYLCRYYGKRVIILLDEYDTPMQEAYVNGYWEELAAFTRSLYIIKYL